MADEEQQGPTAPPAVGFGPCASARRGGAREDPALRASRCPQLFAGARTKGAQCVRVELPGAAARTRVRDEGTGRRWRGAGLHTCVCGTRAAGPGMLLRRRHSSLHSRAHCNR